MDTDTILASVDFDRAELDSLVAHHRTLTEQRETVLAHELPVEELATAVLELANRLAAVTSTVAPHQAGFSPAGDLARRVAAAAAPHPVPGVKEAAGRLFGVEAGGTPETGMLSESHVYGMPGHRLVSWFRMDIAGAAAAGNGWQDLTERRYALVSLATLAATEVQDRAAVHA